MKTGALRGVLFLAVIVWASGWEPERGDTAVFVVLLAAGFAFLGACIARMIELDGER